MLEAFRYIFGAINDAIGARGPLWIGRALVARALQPAKPVIGFLHVGVP
jgi:hypothetical protein